MKQGTNILIAGVGGQGTLLTSRILGRYALSQGLEVKVSEVHGMAQRGGSVVTHLRMGERVFSPLIELGEADILLSFEVLEAARALPLVKREGLVITNTQRISPMPVITGATEYPGNLVEAISAKRRCIALDAFEMANSLGETRAVNCVLLGVMTAALGWEEADMLASLAATVPPKTVEINAKAFQLGFKVIGGSAG